jgi:hypothetical protein
MNDWRASILSQFVPGLKPVTAVCDSDGILREPGLLAALEQKLGRRLSPTIIWNYPNIERLAARLSRG